MGFGIFDSATKSCDAAKGAVLAAKAAINAADVAWESKKQICKTSHQTRQQSFCLFGTDLQLKCEKFAAHGAQMDLIDGVGNRFSHSDRVAEWKTTAKTKCILQKIMDGVELDQHASESCDASGSYDRDVGELDRNEAVFTNLTTVDQFTCTESSIKFGNGKSWDHPHKLNFPTSRDYKV